MVFPSACFKDFPLKTASTREMASGPETRMMANAPTPGGVATAHMVS